MGTRALIHIKDQGKTLVTIYKHWDGYPDGLGKNLERLLEGASVKNGYQYGDEAPKVFNGMGCLAAWLIKALKEGIGDVYLYPPDSTDTGEEYVYIISVQNNRLCLNTYDVGDPDKDTLAVLSARVSLDAYEA